MKKTNAYIIKMHENVIKLIDSGELENAKKIINSILSEKGFNKTSETQIKFNFASLYIDIAGYYSKDIQYLDEADLILKKTSDVFKKIKNTIPKEFELNLKLNTASIFLIKYDVQYAKNQALNKNYKLTYNELNSIYDIENLLLDSIKIYRECFKLNLEKEEQYNIRNNIANCLIRAGRYIESIELLNENQNQNPERWQSFASYADALFNFGVSGLLPLTVSFFLKIIESDSKSLSLNPYELAKNEIVNNKDFCIKKLNDFGLTYNEGMIQMNNIKEKEEFKSLNQLRQFVLINNLALNEHSIYCRCKDARIDNLKIGRLDGSEHNASNYNLLKLDGIVNRLLSEFSYCRFLFFLHISGISNTPDDVEFSNLSNENDLLGYCNEQLRTSYRLAYSVLDKIMNGIVELYKLNKTKNTYFENLFSKNRLELNDKNNIHLAALFSISIELNQEDGVLTQIPQ
jgi:tetratricopeptide (TPR) repeat protein